jgi:hypothetical protein
MNVVYPDGQAWTTPNETGSCAPKEGPADLSSLPYSCTTKSRPILFSQGKRAVLEITDPVTPDGQAYCQNQAPVPSECQQNP